MGVWINLLISTLRSYSWTGCLDIDVSRSGKETHQTAGDSTDSQRIYPPPWVRLGRVEAGKRQLASWSSNSNCDAFELSRFEPIDREAFTSRVHNKAQLLMSAPAGRGCSGSRA